MAYFTEWLGVVGLSWLISYSPRFKRPPLGFLYARRDGTYALALFLLILVIAFIYSFVNPPVFPDPLPLTPAPVQDLNQAALLAGLCLVPFIAALYFRNQPLKSTGWNPQLLMPGLQMGLALAFVTIFLRNRVWDVLGGFNGPVLYLLVAALVVSVFEETIFRGYIHQRLSWWLGKWAGLVITALLFTLWHLPTLLRGLAVEEILIISGMTFAQGLVLGWVMDKSGHVFAPALYRAVSIWIIYLT